MCSTQDSVLKTKLLQLECHFTWSLSKEDADLTAVSNRLEDNFDLGLGGFEGAARVYSIQGFIKYLLGLYNEALSNFQKSEELIRQYPGDNCDKLLVVTYGNLAWLLYHMEKVEECESYLNKLKEINEKYPPPAPSVPFLEVLGEKGWTFLKFSDKYYDMAVACFSKAVELEPDGGEWNAGYAIALYRKKIELSNATDCPTINQLRRAIHTKPDDDVLKVLLGLRLKDYKEYNEAKSLVEQVLARSPENPHVIGYAGQYFRSRESVERSIALLKRALEKSRKSSFIHHQLAVSYMTKKVNVIHAARHHNKGAEIQMLRDQCIYHLEEAIKLNPSFIYAMSDLAKLYGENQDFLKAEEMFQTSFQIARERNNVYQYLTFKYAEFQQYDKRCEPQAIKYHMECLQMGPATVGGKRSAACLTKIAEKRIERNPNDGEAFGILGFIHKEKGDKRLAIEYYEKALTYTKKDEYLSNLCELRLSLQ